MRVDIHGKYFSSNNQNILANEDISFLRVNDRGILMVELYSPNQGSYFVGKPDNADGQAAGGQMWNLSVVNRNTVFNGTSWDRMRGDVNGSLVEQRFLYSRKTADGQVKAGAGFLHAITIAPLAVPTGGLLTIYDSLTEGGNIIFSEWIFATTSPSRTIILNTIFTAGCYIGFDGTLAGIGVTASYR